jgi:hypothetical protein
VKVASLRGRKFDYAKEDGTDSRDNLRNYHADLGTSSDSNTSSHWPTDNKANRRIERGSDALGVIRSSYNRHQLSILPRLASNSIALKKQLSRDPPFVIGMAISDKDKSPLAGMSTRNNFIIEVII